MRLRFDESKIRYYADKYLDEEKDYDNPVESIVDDVKGRGYLTKSDLIALSYWVKNRCTHLIKSHSDDFIKERTGFALSSATAKPDRVRLKGVGLVCRLCDLGIGFTKITTPFGPDPSDTVFTSTKLEAHQSRESGKPM